MGAFDDAAGRPRACARGGLVARIGRVAGPFWPSPVSGARCRSSVVEHSIGNGEVDSSILSGSTSFHVDNISKKTVGTSQLKLLDINVSRNLTTIVPDGAIGFIGDQGAALR